MTAETDLLILGGGCAGLSLARELAGLRERCPSTRILEQRVHYENDRTWCFWGNQATLMSHLVEHRWSRAQLRSQQRAVSFDCSAHPYQMISGIRFYDDALLQIATAPQIELETAITILSEPRLVIGGWQVETDHGLRRAKRLIDTRGSRQPQTQTASPILWQSFLGQVICCDAPVFDPTTVTLMDFADDPAAGIVFTYLLPLSDKRALIEVTVFGKTTVSAAELASPLAQQIRARTGSHASAVERTEYGVLPMGLPPQEKALRKDYPQAGLMHGAARASTGYAFQRIQHWAQQCAAQFDNGIPPRGHQPDRRLTRSMDRLFLSLLRNQPALAPKLFLDMFEHSKPAALIRFLSDRASLRDYLGIISALPAAPFIRQIGCNLAHAL